MKFRLKRWHKITLISIAGILAILILFNVWLNYFLRNNMEESFNSMLNAKVKIEKVRVNFFSGSIKILNLSIIGKNEFSKDTLLLIDKLIIKPSSFDLKAKNLEFEELNIQNIKLKNIVSASGSNCWTNILIKNNETEKDSISDDFSLFVKNIIISNGQIENIDRKSNTIQLISKINIKVESEKEKDLGIINCEFTSDFIAIADYWGEKTISLNGKLCNNENKINSEAVFSIDGFPINLNLNLDLDSLSIEESTLKIEADLANLPKVTDVASKGKLSVEVSSFGIFNSTKKTNFAAKILADSVILINQNNNKSIFADFDLKIDFFNSVDNSIRLSSDKIFLISDDKQLSGNFEFALDDTIFTALSDISGVFSTGVLDEIYSDKTFMTEFGIAANSNLNGVITSKSNNLTGNYYSNVILTSEYFSVPEFSINCNKDMLEFSSSLVSDIVKGNINYQLSEFQNYFKSGYLQQNISADIEYIKIPEIADKQDIGSIGDIKNFNSKPADFQFPKKTETNISIKIDSIIAGTKAFTKLEAEIMYNPDIFEISKFTVEIGNGQLFGKLNYKRNENNSIIKSSLILQDLDLNFFADSATDISGLINFDFNNTFYLGNDSTSIKESKGTNSLRIENFKLKTGLFQEYELDVEYLAIANTELIAELQNGLLKLQPIKLYINDAEINVKGDYNIVNDSILFSALIDMPDKYMSSKIKFLISMFSESSKKEIPEKENRNTYLLKITGTANKPEFRIFK